MCKYNYAILVISIIFDFSAKTQILFNANENFVGFVYILYEIINLFFTGS